MQQHKKNTDMCIKIMVFSGVVHAEGMTAVSFYDEKRAHIPIFFSFAIVKISKIFCKNFILVYEVVKM